MQHCTAHTRSGAPCTNVPVRGAHTCRMHGGTQPTGIASPNIKTGRYSKYLPAGLLERYEAGRRDPDLLALRDEISLIDVRMGELVSRLDRGDSAARWATVRAAYQAYQAALEAEDEADADDCLAALGRAIYAGRDDDGVWGAIAELALQRQRLADGERKRLVDLQQSVSTAEANMLVLRLAGIIREHVTDQNTRAAIQRDFTALLGTAGRLSGDD